jgi:regulation of enolase protein 1 (concanavalin A-like superfamily)
MYRRIDSLDAAAKMPPVARNTIDPDAVQAIGQWISGMPPVGGLPKPWIAEDVGTVGQPGDSMVVKETFAVTGGGSDIWDNADGFNFVYQPLKGDGQITARVNSISEGDGWEKAGVMIREKATADSRHAFMAMTRDQGAAFQRRVAPAGTSEHTPGPGPGARAPFWVKLQRTGNTLAGYVSPDGQKWDKVGDASIAMGPEALIGLAVTAHNNGALCNATFDNVRIESGTAGH